MAYAGRKIAKEKARTGGFVPEETYFKSTDPIAADLHFLGPFQRDF